MVIKSFAPFVFRHAPVLDYVGINITFSMESTKRCLLLCLQDKEDDLKVGVKSTALRFGDSTKEWITGFGILCISSLGLSGYNAEIGISIFLYFQFLFALIFFNYGYWNFRLMFFFFLPSCHAQTANRGTGWPYYGLLAVASGQLAWQIWTVDLSSRLDCNRKYVSL